MAPIHEACIAFSHNRSCFISVPEKWIAHDLAFQDIPVIKIEYSDSHKAYFSTKVGVPSSCFEVDVQLNGKYAQSLGLKEGEQVLVQQVEGNTVHAEKVYLEPLNSDDWEIMELNTAIIEKDLLNQIRVVWKGQVFPIWAHNASFCVRVAEVEPDIEPVLLVEWTEIHVIPKDRNAIGALGYLPSLKQKRKDMCEQYKHLRKTKKLQKSSHASSQQSSPASDVVDSDKLELPGTFSLPAGQASLPAIRPSFSLFRYVMKTVFQNESHHLSQSNKSFSSRFIPLNVIFRLRVISCSKNTTEGLPLALQATTVFISDTTFRALCDIYPIPNCFVAMLSKLPSPDDLKERQQALQAQLQTAKDSKSRKKKSEILPIEKNSILDSIYVNVVVLRSLKEEFEAPLALFMNRNFIAVPLEIKRRLGLEISSCVRCQSVEKPPIALNSIILHPLESLKGNFTDAQITEAFRKWAEDANLEDSSMVLADGTLVKLNINKSRSCDFIVLMLQSENEDVAVTSPSTLSNTSMSSTDSEKNIGPLPSTLNYGFLNYENLPNLQIKYGVFSPQLSKSIWCHGSALNKVEVLYQRLPALGLEALGGVKKLAEEAMIDFELWFHLSPLALEFSSRAFNIGCMLVHGPKGVGKTTLLKALCKNLMNYPYFIFISIIECLPLRGKRVETISKKWDAVLAEAAHRQPALIIFEDLDKLASAPATPEQEAGPDAIYFSSVAQTFITLTEKIMDNKASIVVVATAKSIHDLYPSLNTAQGRHVFQSILEIKPPTVEYRFEMLQSLVLSKIHISADSLETVDWRNLARVTEGYVAQDLESLVDRATHAAFVRTNFAMEKNSDGTEQISLIYDDFENALATYTPSSLRGLQLQDGNNKTWNDVGGLQQVKAAIEETIVWPIRYKELFKDYHLRPQTNILLYGVPGTGKTMIAGVVASECGLNFISIKGPELLSKYIGASEQAVRDLFARAASAKPCVLFFDEFDALAPQRGHDSTGVTDRVVNQLLTQMDGVENLEGVYILAATSRPELIDPALLRPGRFDKCLLCPLPNNEERLAILIALSSKLSLSEDVDFKAIIPMTEYFSGADLQALLYSAQIQAVRETQASRSRRCSISVDDTFELPFEERITYMPTLEQGAVVPSVAVANEIVQEMNTLFNNISLQNGEPESTRRRRTSTISLLIEQRHILNVLSDTRPSVSAEERRRYERIFKKFQKSPATGFSSPDKDNKRVTLA